MDTVLAKMLDTFFSKYTRIKYKKGDIILRAEDTPQGVFFLKKGYVKVYLISETGSMLTLHIFKPGSFFPLTWVINDTPNTYYYEAVTNIDVWRAPKESVREFLHDYPAITANLASRLLSGMTGMMKRMEYLIMDDAEEKTILLFLYFGDMLGVREGEKITLPIPVTHREIAAWIGTTRETASLQVENLKRKNLLVYKKRQIIIPNRDALSNAVKK